MSLDRFNGKSVLVTGAGSGIGAAVAKRFSDEGANVTILSRTRADLEQTAAGMAGDRTLIVPADVSDWNAMQDAVRQAVDRFGGLDVLVANAGIHIEGTVAETSPEDFRKVVDIDLTGIFLSIKAAYDALKASGGNVVVTSSVSGIGGDWSKVAYNAAKGGVTNMVRAIALDAGKDGVRVNAVNPTLTRSGLTEEMVADKSVIDAFNQRVPLGAPAEADWIAGPVAFLASDDARYVTGVNLPVDGGLSASNGQPAG